MTLCKLCSVFHDECESLLHKVTYFIDLLMCRPFLNEKDVFLILLDACCRHGVLLLNEARQRVNWLITMPSETM